MELGKVKSVYENSDPIVSPISYSNAKIMLESASDQALMSPNIQSGQNEVKVEVTLVYEVK
jgi:uncharacterized protein YggE